MVEVIKLVDTFQPVLTEPDFAGMTRKVSILRKYILVVRIGVSKSRIV